jgi:hypothetical protein
MIANKCAAGVVMPLVWIADREALMKGRSGITTLPGTTDDSEEDVSQ